MREKEAQGQIKHLIKHCIGGVIILSSGLLLASCGQTGGLYLVDSEAEYNEGHFMLPYRGDDKGRESSSDNLANENISNENLSNENLSSVERSEGSQRNEMTGTNEPLRNETTQ